MRCGVTRLTCLGSSRTELHGQVHACPFSAVLMLML